MPQRGQDQEVHLLAKEQRHSTDSLDHQDNENEDGYTEDATCNTRQNRARTRLKTAGGRGPKTSQPTGGSDLDDPFSSHSNSHSNSNTLDTDEDDDDGLDGIQLDNMDPDARRPGYRRPNEGKSGTPLLYKGDQDVDEERGLGSNDKSHTNMDDDDGPYYQPPTMQRPSLSRRSTMHSHGPREIAAAAAAARRKYTYAAFFLGISLVSFCIQTELSAYIQHDLGWDKAYCMMYFTHGSWVVLYPFTLLCLRLRKRDTPWETFWRRHKDLLRSTATMVEMQTLDVMGASVQSRSRPIQYLIRVTAFITSSLTVAGLSWYIAVSMTTPSDLTAIYNCSAFFAYVFSVPILREPLRFDKSVAVLIAIIGVLVVAYGDTDTSTAGEGDAATPPPGHSDEPSAGSRFFGNLIIGVGSVLYGLYEVLYKRFACPPDGVSPDRGMIFAMTFGSCIGFFTLTVLWIPLPILHFLNIEIFELPVASTCGLILCAVLANATFSGSFLVLISLTSPVLSSVAALLTIFIVAIADWVITGDPLSAAAIVGGSMIIVAFLALSWSTYREMTEHEAQKLEVDFTESDDEGDLNEHER